MRRKLRIFDTQFAHGTALGSGDLPIHPTEFFWTRQDDSDFPEIAVISESCFHEVDNISAKHKVGLIIEPQSIETEPYQRARNEQFVNKFDFIFTHSQSLINTNPSKFKFYPFMGCWIKPEDRKIHEKTSMTSIIASSKAQTFGHQLRHEAISRYGMSHKFMSVYGRGYRPVDYKLEALGPYRFSIVIENEKSPTWFTEKLCDCFATGTVPIYWGATNIGDYFDASGIIQFDTIEQLGDILFKLKPEDYDSRMDAVKANLAKNEEHGFLPDNYIFSVLKKEYSL
jgi:hypothetical protein